MIRETAFYIFHRYFKRDDFFKLAGFFNQSQYWDRERILDYQWNMFLDLLEYSYENVPYYRQMFKKKGILPGNINTRKDLTKIDILTKEIVRSNFDKIKAHNITKASYKFNATSGSTGENFNFLSDKSIIRSALQKRCYDWMGIDYLDKKITIWGAFWDVSKSQKFESSIKRFIKRGLVLSGYNLSEKDIEKYYVLMLKFKPKLLVSYPSILYNLAQVFDDNSFNYNPISIQIGGEKLFQFQRDYIEKIFKAPVFDFYGARDIRLIAQECDKHEGLHIMAENVLVEVLDENDQPIDEGEGDLVITDLHNKVMPFIRYRIGDRAVITKGKCSCGRGLPLLKEIIGRSFEIIEFPNGNKVGGTFWTIVLKSEPGIKSFQIIQKDINHILINYVPYSDIEISSLDGFIRRIRKYAGADLKITFKEVKNIPLTKGGKFRFVISELNDEKSTRTR